MNSVWPDVCCANLPREALAALAGLRHVPDVRVLVAGERAWVFWEAGREEILTRLLPLTGARFYTRREGVWYPPGGHLPAFEVPAEREAMPLYRVLFPDTVRPEHPSAVTTEPQRLRLERDDRPRPTRAMRCPLAELARWAETAPVAQLAGIRAARSGATVLLLGDDRPALPARPRPPDPAGRAGRPRAGGRAAADVDRRAGGPRRAAALRGSRPLRGPTGERPGPAAAPPRPPGIAHRRLQRHRYARPSRADPTDPVWPRRPGIPAPLRRPRAALLPA